MKWFGKPYGALYEADTPHTLTPTGERCGHCQEPIGPEDDGLILPCMGFEDGRTQQPFHYECHLRGVLGGYNHLMGNCTCCGGNLPPDPIGMTLREAAKLACKEWHRRHHKENP